MHSKGNYQTKDKNITNWMGENICKKYYQYVVFIKNINSLNNSTSKDKWLGYKMDWRPEWTFFWRGHADGQQAHEKMLNIANHQRMEVKTTVRCHLTSVKIAIIKKNTNNKCWWGWGEKRTLLHCWWRCKSVQPLWKTVRFLKKLKTELPWKVLVTQSYPTLWSHGL